MYYFQLFQVGTVVTQERRASARIMKAFCILNSQDQSAIDEIFCATVLKMHVDWIELAKDPKINMMHFRRAIISATEYMENVLRGMPYNMLELKRMSFSN